MPRVVEYSQVLARLTSDGLVCNYYNGGAFGFASGAIVRGWIGQTDQSIRQQMRENIRIVPEDKLVNLAIRAWVEILGGNAWVMPGSSWSYELNFGARGWLPNLLQSVGIDSNELADRTDAAAIEFTPVERQECQAFISGLLTKLSGSDFTLAFAGRKAVCTIHHHRQLWWVTNARDLAVQLDQLISGPETLHMVPAKP